MPALKIGVVFAAVFMAQLLVAPLLQLGEIRPDFVLILLVFISARYGRMVGILAGFTMGLLQDVTGAVSVVGANALSKSVVGFAAGTLNGTLSIWTSKVVNIYIYGSLVGHAAIYHGIMLMGLSASFGIYANHMIIEALVSSLMMTGSRYLIPLVPSRI